MSCAARVPPSTRSVRPSPSCASMSAPTATRSTRASRRSSTPPARSSASRSGWSARSAPRLRPMPRFTYGGQALIEGVLMRGRDAIAVAFRHPDGRIVWAAEPLDTGPHGWRLAKAPLVRGLIVLYETLIVGTRWLVRSANLQASGEGVELGRGSVAILLILTLAAGIGVFFLLPLFIASVTTSAFSKDAWVQNLAEG